MRHELIHAFLYISIHAPTRGATSKDFQSIKRHLFQSTLPQGERLGLAKKGYWVGGFQSTLPQGERRRLEPFMGYPDDFNPRSHKGSDERHERTKKSQNTFQSTLPQGERRYSAGRLLLTRPISIHAPTRGATEGRMRVYYQRGNFNPRSHKGSDSFE